MVGHIWSCGVGDVSRLLSAGQTPDPGPGTRNTSTCAPSGQTVFIRGKPSCSWHLLFVASDHLRWIYCALHILWMCDHRGQTEYYCCWHSSLILLLSASSLYSEYSDSDVLLIVINHLKGICLLLILKVNILTNLFISSTELNHVHMSYDVLKHNINQGRAVIWGRWGSFLKGQYKLYSVCSNNKI